jgi:hypothetical protein
LPRIWSAGAVALILLAAGPTSATGQSPPLRLPDLEQERPASLRLRVERSGRTHLGFRSAVRNVGTGPLVIEGRRSTTRVPTMTALQRIRRADGSTLLRPSVGPLRYVRSGGHEHWHVIGFMRYELRRARDSRLVRPDRKTGFCLGDRYDVNPLARRPFEPATAVFRTNCGLLSPRLRRVVEGISVGYADDYHPHLEGQYIDITGLPAGRYWLVHRSDPERRLLESNRSNNVAMLLIELRRLPGGAYRVGPA